MPASNTWSYQSNPNQSYWFYSGIILLSVILALYSELYLLAAAPLALYFAIAVIKDYRILYYAFFAVVPFSIEFFVGSVGTDLPSEPVMLLLTGVAIILFITKLKSLDLSYVFHPIGAILFLHIVWILITAIFSQSPVVSFKFFLAKLWYVIPFFFLSLYLIQGPKMILRIVKILAWFLTAAILVVLIRHALEGFTFESSNRVVMPIFRNHVSYSAIIVIVLPFIWALYTTVADQYKKLLIAVLVVFVLGTYFSYTRAAQLCLFIAVGTYFVIKYRLAKLAIISSVLAGIVLVGYLMNDNKFMDYAPDFEKTIVHTDFDNLLEATYKMEDISTMERVYRWVAGTQMVQERPIIGFGPGSFYNHYKNYTIRAFETYVSYNPEKSGIHCYYFMTLVEQGIIGLIIFLAFCFAIILYGERYYHEMKDKVNANLIMAATVSTVIICAMILINDLIEIDKVGPFFFLNAAIILKLGTKPSIPSES